MQLRLKNRANLRLLHGPRWRRRTQGACSSLPLALRWRVLAATTRHLHQSCRWFAFATEDAMQLRLPPTTFFDLPMCCLAIGETVIDSSNDSRTIGDSI